MPAELLWLWTAIIFVFGLMIGSFLNVCIYRLPRGKSLNNPKRSYCPACHEQIAWYDNIPLLSYVLLGGVCRQCGSRISPRYFFVELLTGVLMAVAFFTLLGRGETPGAACVYIATMCVLLVASFIDIDLRIIPDELTIGGILFAPAFSVLVPSLHQRPELGRSLMFFAGNTFWGALGASLVGMAVGAFIVYGSGVLGKVLFRKEAMGGGDVKLMAFLGGILGWKLVLLTFFFSTVPGALYGLTALLRTRDHHIPFGPFLSLAAVAVILFARPILMFVGLEWIIDPAAWRAMGL